MPRNSIPTPVDQPSGRGGQDEESVLSTCIDPTHGEPEGFTRDPFVHFGDSEPSTGASILTLRAILLGSLCGGLVNASNIYLGLKTGWTSSANILGVSGIVPLMHTYGYHDLLNSMFH